MRRCAALLVALLGAAPAPGGAESRPALEDPAPAGPEAEIWALLSPRARKDAPDEAAIAAAIAHLGGAAAEPALAIYLGLRTEPEPEPGVALDGRVIEARPRILLAALGKLPRAAVLVQIDSAATAGDVDRNLALCRVLARLGGTDALRRIVALAAALDPIQWERTFVQVPLQESLAALVSATPRDAQELASRLRSSPPGLGMILARALGEARAAQTAPELANALGRDSRLDQCLAEVLAELGDAAAGNLPETALDSLRRLFDRGDAAVVRAAATALARLGDAESAPRLVELLGSRDPAQATAAQAALRTLSAAGLPADRAAWERWLEAERTWATERLASIEDDLLEADAARVAEAVAELRNHPLYRHRAALAVAAALQSDDAAVVELACSALPGFRSRAVVPALERLAREGTPELRGNAEQALHALTGSGDRSGATAGA